MKKFISLLLCMVVIFSYIPVFSDDTIESQNTEEKTLHLKVQYGSMEAYVPNQNIRVQTTTGSAINLVLSQASEVYYDAILITEESFEKTEVFINDSLLGTYNSLSFDSADRFFLTIKIYEGHVVFDTERFFIDYDIKIQTPDGQILPKAHGVYAKSVDQIYFYIPQDTEAKIEVRGILSDNTQSEILGLAFFDQNITSHLYNGETHVFSAGATINSDGDNLMGHIAEFSTIFQLKVYRGKLGILNIEDIDGTPYEGEIAYNISYQAMNSGGEGANANAHIVDGKLYICIRDDLLSLEYAYIVASPFIRQGDKIQANTPYIDLMDRLTNANPDYYDLGTVRFQVPEFIGRLYDSDKTTPFENAYIMIRGEFDVPLEEKWMLPAVQTYIANAQENGKNHVFYLASFGNQFESTYKLNASDSEKLIEETFQLSKENLDFYVPADQILIQFTGPDGEPLDDSYLHGKQVFMAINGDYLNQKRIYIGFQSEIVTGGVEEGDRITLWLDLNQGNFDYLGLTNSLKWSFVYTSEPGSYEMEDAFGNKRPYTVDANGLAHVDLPARHSQFQARVFFNDVPVQNHLWVNIYDSEGNSVANNFVHHAQFLGDGFINVWSEKNLEGTYELVISDPTDSVEFYGVSMEVTLPMPAPTPADSQSYFRIDMPPSKVYGQLTFEGDDFAFYNEYIDRVYVNIFDAKGAYVKHALVRNDGLFSGGYLAEGRYFAKAFVSPSSNVADQYATSKMEIFQVTADGQAYFEVPLLKFVAQGRVVSPTGDPIPDAWVRLYNAQNIEVEAMRTDGQGYFKIPILNEGNYKLKAFGKNGFYDSIMHEWTVGVNNTVESSEPVLVLTTAQLVGRTQASSQVVLYDANLNLISTTISDLSGNYAFGGLSEGDYWLQVSPQEKDTYATSDLIKITYDGHLLVRDIQLQNVGIIGRVFAPSGELLVSDGWVHLYRNDVYHKSVPYDENGYFYLEQIEASYELVAQCSTNTFANTSKVIINPGDTTVSLSLRSNTGVRGTLRFDTERLINTIFILYNDQGLALRQERTNVFGEINVSDLSMGSYYLVVPMDAFFYYAEFTISDINGNLGDIHVEKRLVQ